LDVIDKETGDRTGGEVTVDRAVRPEDLHLASVRQLEHPETLLFQLGSQTQHATQKGDGLLRTLRSGTDPTHPGDAPS
jgi:hypothetical protein